MFCLVIVSRTAAADATAKTTAADGDSQWGINLQTERQHQEFNDSSADITTISLLPYLQIGNWDFSVDLPWQRAEGGYFVNHFQPTPKYYCQYDPVSIKNKRKQARRIKAQLANCGAVATTQPDSVEGWSDATVFAHYGIPLDKVGVRFYVADYLGADGYPNREYGGSVALFF